MEHYAHTFAEQTQKKRMNVNKIYYDTPVGLFVKALVNEVGGDVMYSNMFMYVCFTYDWFIKSSLFAIKNSLLSHKIFFSTLVSANLRKQYFINESFFIFMRKVFLFGLEIIHRQTMSS